MPNRMGNPQSGEGDQPGGQGSGRRGGKKNGGNGPPGGKGGWGHDCQQGTLEEQQVAKHFLLINM